MSSPLTGNLSDQIYGELRARLLAGAFRPGERLSEAAIAEDFGVSRGPVREALRLLVSDRLAIQKARKGVYVPIFDAQAFAEICELREALETMSARLAALRATAETVAQMKHLLRETSEAIKRSPHYPGDLDLHAAIAAAAGNRALSELIAETNTRLGLVRLRSGDSVTRAPSAYDEHLEIVLAIEARDPDAAEAAMRRHLQHAFENAALLLEASS